MPYSEIDLQLDDSITQVLGKISFKIAHIQKNKSLELNSISLTS
jgi:hypothetical protein